MTYYKHQVDDTIVGLFSKIQLAKIKFNLFGSLDLPAESFRDHVVEGGGCFVDLFQTLQGKMHPLKYRCFSMIIFIFNNFLLTLGKTKISCSSKICCNILSSLSRAN